jgi:superfamily II DNA/RNA helicase
LLDLLGDRSIDLSHVEVLVLDEADRFDMPDTVDAYAHRVGRTGRAEKSGEAFTFIVQGDEPLVRRMERCWARGPSDDGCPVLTIALRYRKANPGGLAPGISDRDVQGAVVALPTATAGDVTADSCSRKTKGRKQHESNDDQGANRRLGNGTGVGDG